MFEIALIDPKYALNGQNDPWEVRIGLTWYGWSVKIAGLRKSGMLTMLYGSALIKMLIIDAQTIAHKKLLLFELNEFTLQVVQLNSI